MTAETADGDNRPVATGGPFSPVEQSELLAENLLFPTAAATDASDRVPRSHLDALADAGLYGLYGPPEAGGLGVDQATGLRVVEVLAGACLSTTFVWTQHHSALRAVAASATPGLRERWLEPLCRGKWRAGIAVAGIRPGAVAVTARAVAGGWRLTGEVPWVTGWGLIDVVRTAALGPDGDIVWTLIDAVESPSLTCRRLALSAVNASVTVTVSFHDLFVAAERVTDVEGYDDWAAHDARGLRRNGSLALGVAGRCCRLLGPSPLDEQLLACRHALDRAAGLVDDRGRPGDEAESAVDDVGRAGAGAGAVVGAGPPGAGAGAVDPDVLALGRAAAAELAVRAAAALVVATGSRAVLADQHPQRLAREATFLLVFASRANIRKELLPRFAGR
jgi:alkylation response protein AidB-like acyl-CoA dehydrogenase